jgi:hypothetical protein
MKGRERKRKVRTGKPRYSREVQKVAPADCARNTTEEVATGFS